MIACKPITMAFAFPSFGGQPVSARAVGHARLEPRRRTPVVIPCCCSAVTSSTARLRLEINTVAGKERGIFGMEDDQRDALEDLIRAVEKDNPTREPTANNALAASGAWRLLYTNLEILGRRRVRLAIATSRKSGFVKLGDFVQIVDPSTQQSTNIVHFSVLTGGTGTFTITADYKVASETRVEVSTVSTALEPQSFERLLGENRNLLLEIFDPTGFLEITYIDDDLRIGRDNKGHVFVLEKTDA